MVALKLVENDYHPVVETSDCEESVICPPSKPEVIEQEYLDFAENAMEKAGDDPETLAKYYNIHIGMLSGGTLKNLTREETRHRLAAVFKLRDTEPWEEAGFGD